MSCYVPWDEVVRAGQALALCGQWVNVVDHANAPTCRACRTELARTAEEVFGPPPARADRLAAVKRTPLRVTRSTKRREVA